MPPSVLIMLIGDQPAAASILEMIRDEPDMKLYYCSNPDEAVAAVERVHPTVILQELSPSQGGGAALIRNLRMSPAASEVPLIVISNSADPAAKAAAFAAGANNYLVNMPGKVEFIARMRYHSAAYLGLLERNLAYQRLNESQQALRAELAEAATYVKSLLPPPIDEEMKIAWRFVPSMLLGGDAFGYHWVDNENFAFYLLDVCGHGVGAALLSISVTNVLRAQSLPDTDFLKPDQVLEALNARFPMEEHRNMFFTIWYGVYNKTNRMLTYSSGGHPPAILITVEQGKQVSRELSTFGLVIGAMPGTQLHASTCVIGKGDRLYLFSDGIYELQSPKGHHLQWREFVDELEKRPAAGKEKVDDVIEFSSSFVGTQAFPDDVSILEIVFR